jgi:signal transduction histidine kinase
LSAELPYPAIGKRNVEISLIPKLDGARRVLGIVSLTVDVTAQRAVESQLRQSQKMDAVGQLTGGVAHDLNNLLAIITGNADLYAGRHDANNPCIQAISAAADRAVTLIRQLLAFSRQQVLKPTLFDPAKLVHGNADLLVRSLGESVTIDIDAPTDTRSVHADRNELQNALLNLSLNARDAVPGGGRLSISVRNSSVEDARRRNTDTTSGEYAAISVRDNGMGMDEGTRAQAIDPFFTTKPPSTGSGLGLSMVHGFARQSDGHIQIDSSLGKRTEITLYIPRAIGESVEDRPAPSHVVLG